MAMIYVNILKIELIVGKKKEISFFIFFDNIIVRFYGTIIDLINLISGISAFPISIINNSNNCLYDVFFFDLYIVKLF